MITTVFSEYELREMGFKVGEATEHKAASCVGTCEVEMECKNVTKSCRGTVVKNIPRGTGAGTMTVSMHIPYDIYMEAYGTDVDGLIEGVSAYGRNSRHKVLSITQHVFDEDGVEKYKAYPNCIITTAKKSSIENGAEEVAEVELEITIMPDEYGNGEYEAIASELETSIAGKWMTEFTPAMVRVASV